MKIKIYTLKKCFYNEINKGYVKGEMRKWEKNKSMQTGS